MHYSWWNGTLDNYQSWAGKTKLARRGKDNGECDRRCTVHEEETHGQLTLWLLIMQWGKLSGDSLRRLVNHARLLSLAVISTASIPMSPHKEHLRNSFMRKDVEFPPRRWTNAFFSWKKELCHCRNFIHSPSFQTGKKMSTNCRFCNVGSDYLYLCFS